MYTHVILALSSINVPCLQQIVFSFEKSPNSQDHSSSDSQNQIKNFLYSKIFNSPHLEKFPLTPEQYLIKTWISNLHYKLIFGKRWLRLKLSLSAYCVPSWLKRSWDRSWNIRLNNFEANWTQIYNMPIKVLFSIARLFYH